MTDMVNSPKHYQTENGMEAIDVIEAFFHSNSHLANAFKYLARAGKKGDYAEDLRKSIWYISRELERTRPPAGKTKPHRTETSKETLVRLFCVTENNLDRVKHGTHQETCKSHCPRGHELADPNLRADQKRRGKRSCLACGRASAYVAYRKELKPFKKEIADKYYEKIMEGK